MFYLLLRCKIYADAGSLSAARRYDEQLVGITFSRKIDRTWMEIKICGYLKEILKGLSLFNMNAAKHLGCVSANTVWGVMRKSS